MLETDVGRILNTKDCVSISGYSPFEKGGNRGILIFSQLQGGKRGICGASRPLRFARVTPIRCGAALCLCGEITCEVGIDLIADADG